MILGSLNVTLQNSGGGAVAAGGTVAVFPILRQRPLSETEAAPKLTGRCPCESNNDSLS